MIAIGNSPGLLPIGAASNGATTPPLIRLLPSHFVDLRPGGPETGTPMAAFDGNPNTYADQWEASYGGGTWHFVQPITVVSATVTSINNVVFDIVGQNNGLLRVPAKASKAQSVWNQGEFLPFQTDHISFFSPSGARIRIHELELMGYLGS